ncbi:arylsulfatase B [Anabrus simplex]|uniref:arylsulfatase B n=1 Tax=Anabrus simplex TaxID=316456 RepID=UPI0035A357A4
MWGLLSILVIVSSVSASKQPHIVLMLVDDMGWNDISLHGADQIPTPHIDALGASGVLLHRHYSQPSCTPSRTALLTGKYPIRTGMQGGSLNAGERRGVPLDVPLLPERLQELGYTTRMVGKWHLGYTTSEYMPLHRGFDSHFGYLNGQIDYYTHMTEQKVENSSEVFIGLDFRRGTVPDWKDEGKYATELFTEEAEQIIRQHNKDRPLFLYLSHLACHNGNDSIPLQVPSVRQNTRMFRHISHPKRQLYAGIVKALDDSVGKVVKALRDADMLNDSIIIFLSDNGGMPVPDAFLANTGSNWPLRGTRGTVFEGGVRSVAALWSPLIKTPRRLMPQLMHITDWLPTLYRAAGGDPSALGLLDGVDQWDQLTGKSTKSARQEVLLNIDEKAKNSAILQGHWKLVIGTVQGGQFDGFLSDPGRSKEYPSYDAEEVVKAASNMGIDHDLTQDIVLQLRRKASISCEVKKKVNLGTPACPELCLFDVHSDPCEIHNVAKKHPNLVQQLQTRISYFQTQLVPQTNTPVDPRSNPVYFNNTWQPWLD